MCKSISLLIVLSLVLGMVSFAGAETIHYEGSALGFGSLVKVKVELVDGIVVGLEADDSGESYAEVGIVSKSNVEQYIAAVIKAGNAEDVDVHTGATFTCSAIKEVVLQALASSKAEVSSKGISWDCPQCGRPGNTGNFCGRCGSARPKDNLAASENVPINAANFPDDIFRNYVSDHFDTDHDGILSNFERKNVLEIDCRESSISDLKGIEYFTELNYLECRDNELTALDISGNIQLTVLRCASNQLTSLDVTRNTLLTELDCSDNQLDSLDVSNNTGLTILTCSGNRLLALDISKCPSLLDAYRNGSYNDQHGYHQYSLLDSGYFLWVDFDTRLATADLSVLSSSEREAYIQQQLCEIGLARPTTQEEAKVVLQYCPELAGYLVPN